MPDTALQVVDKLHGTPSGEVLTIVENVPGNEINKNRRRGTDIKLVSPT